jgi:hypothetical protein
MRTIGSAVLLTLLFMNSIPALAQKKLANYPKNILYFGKGGGFAGMEFTYALLESGDIYQKKNVEDKFTFITRLSADDTKQIFTNYEFLGIPAMQLNEPGNTYSFIEFSNSSEKHKLIWNGQAAPDNLKLFYSILVHYVKANN